MSKNGKMSALLLWPPCDLNTGNQRIIRDMNDRSIVMKIHKLFVVWQVDNQEPILILDR